MKRYLFFLCTLSLLQELRAQAITYTISQTLVHRVRTFMKKNAIPGIALGIYYQGKPYLYTFGLAQPAFQIPVTPDTLFEIGSITKSFTATLLALAIKRRQAHLTDPLALYFPLLRIRHSLAGTITLEQLATHRSGLARMPPGSLKKRGKKLTRSLVIRPLLQWNPFYLPGTHFLYSNWGFALLGFALEAITGKKYAQLLHENILEPLSMRSTFLRVPPFLQRRYAQGHKRNGLPAFKWRDNALRAGGGLRSSLRDMMQFLMANLGHKGPQWLIQALYYTQQGRVSQGPYKEQALSWSCDIRHGFTLIAKNGGVTGFSSFMAFIPEKDIGIVMLSNRRNPLVTPFARSLLIHLAHL